MSAGADADATSGTFAQEFRTDWVALAREIGPGFAARAADVDETDTFVAENYAELKARRFFSAGVPAELGGGGASHRELCAMLRELARHCGSTALALSMHTHLLAATVWRRRQGQPVEPLLRRIAEEQIVLVSTGASDWLDSSGRADRVEGGYRVTGRKIFGSGSPAGTLLVTSALYDDPADGPTVLHFPVPLAAEGVTVLDNWRTLPARRTSTGSGSSPGLLTGGQVISQAVLTGGPVALALLGGTPAQVTGLFVALALFRAPYTLGAGGWSPPSTGILTRLVVAEKHAAIRKGARRDRGRNGAWASVWRPSSAGSPVPRCCGSSSARLIDVSAEVCLLTAAGSALSLGTLLLSLVAMANDRSHTTLRSWASWSPPSPRV